MILTVAAAVVIPACVGVIGTYMIQQKQPPSERRELATHSSSPLTQSNMNQAHQLQSLIPPSGRLLAALRSLFPRRASTPTQMRVIDSVALGPRDRAFVIEVGESWVVVGRGSNGLSSLGILRKGGAIATDARPPVPLIDALDAARMDSSGQRSFESASHVQLEQPQESSAAPAVLDAMTRVLSALPEQQPATLVQPEVRADMSSAGEAAQTQTELAAAFVQEQAAQEAPAADVEVDVQSGEELLTQGVAEMRQMISAAANGEMPGSVARDDSGFPDVVEAVKAVSAVDPGADAAAQEQETPAKERKSFMQMYSEVKNNA